MAEKADRPEPVKNRLANRYNPELIRQAEQRRQKLNYEQLHVGLNTTPRIDRILRLLYETHQNYYFGHFEAACVLGGVLLEQCLICLLAEEIQEKGSITYRQGQGLVNLRNDEELVFLNMRILINTAAYYKIIPREDFNLATTLRLIRNVLMHDRLGGFAENRDAYEYNLGTETIESILEIPKSEIGEHCLTADHKEIWAYFILTRTRQLMNTMFRERVKRLPPEM
jgi:hypothetical protein